MIYFPFSSGYTHTTNERFEALGADAPHALQSHFHTRKWLRTANVLGSSGHPMGRWRPGRRCWGTSILILIRSFTLGSMNSLTGVRCSQCPKDRHNTSLRSNVNGASSRPRFGRLVCKPYQCRVCLLRSSPNHRAWLAERRRESSGNPP